MEAIKTELLVTSKIKPRLFKALWIVWIVEKVLSDIQQNCLQVVLPLHLHWFCVEKSKFWEKQNHSIWTNIGKWNQV